MDCNRWREMASDYIEETLPPAMREAMRRHVAECASCRSDYAALTALSREMNVLPTVDPPLFFRENVLAAIERQAQTVPLWRRVLFGPTGTLAGAGPDRMARTAFGTLLAAGTAAAIGWTLFMPNLNGAGKASHPTIANLVPTTGLLPGSDATDSGDAANRLPILRVTRVATMTPGNGPVYDLSFWLANANNGVARWQFVGDPKSYTFPLNGSAPQTVRIPYTAAQGKESVALEVHWTADAASHTRYLILPVAQAATNAVASPAPPATHQSFGLPEESLPDAARDLSARYGVPITLDDVPENLSVRITAEDETAQATLQRSLKDAGLTATESAAGIRVAPQGQ